MSHSLFPESSTMPILPVSPFQESVLPLFPLNSLREVVRPLTVTRVPAGALASMVRGRSAVWRSGTLWGVLLALSMS